MTANLPTLTREKRAFPMKRLLMPATALTTLKKAAFTLLCCTVLMVFAAPTAAAQDPCSGLNGVPSALPVGSATGCGVIITLNPANSASAFTITSPGNGNPYDASEDTLVGIVNNSGASLNSITLTSSGAFGFDGDGPCQYASTIAGTNHSINTNDCFGPTGYEGPDNTFTGISGDKTSGTVNFTTPIPNGGSNWFALEGAPSNLTGVTLAPILTVTETGLGAGNVTDTYNTGSPQPGPINCTEAGGGAAQTGVCSETDSSGTMVTLTETPGSTAGGLSTFGGWGGACAGTLITSPTCTVTMSSAQNVTVSFVAATTSSLNPVTLPFNPGTNVTQTFVLCPSNPNPITSLNPCEDPNATAVTVLIPTVNTAFELSVLFTEFSDNGLCPSGGNGQSSEFACRFGSFFNYGTDSNNNTVAPLCYPYLNGNCVHYLLYSGEPGNPPPSTDYSGGVNVDIGFANTSFVPPGPYWTGSTLRELDTPDSDEFDPLPYGAICSSPMLTGPSPGTEYQGPIYCQFDKDVTTFITQGSGLDPIGGKIPQTNDLVVAFLPTSTGTAPVQTPPTPTAPTLAATCPNGCTIGGDPSITFTEGMGGTFQVTIPVTSPPAYPAPTLTEMGTLPGGLTFNSTLGTISGTPADGVAGNYLISFSATNGVGSPFVLNYTLTVAPAPLTITASNGMMTYGGTPPTITPSYSAFVPGDTASSLGTVNCTTNATSSSPVAGNPYYSSCSATDPTYTITPVRGTVTVSPAPLTITASSATMIFGAMPPTITPTFTNNGLVNGDTAASLGVTCSTTATNTSVPGSYPSSCTASNGTNYTITPVNGTVTVLGLKISPLIVTFGPPFYLGQIGVQGITLTNTTTAPITISSITKGGGTAPSDFGDVTFCPPMILKLPATLPAGKSCAIGVGIFATAKVFNPNPSTTYLTITDSAATQQVLLTAMVTDPVVSLSTTSLSFQKEETGTTSVAQKVTLTNSGLTPLTLTGLTISGNFALTSGAGTNCTTLPPPLSPGGTCLIYVNFTPTSKGPKSGSVTITDLTLFGRQTISLSGTGN